MRTGSSGVAPQLLVVDDEESVRRTLRRALGRLGYRVTVAASGEEALRAMRQRCYEVIVTDLRMPGMDGLSLIEEGRRCSPTSAFVILTGATTLDLRPSEAGDDSIVSVLGKPWDEDELVRAIERALALSARRESEPAGLKVLLIEDDPVDAERVSRDLRAAASPFDVTHAPRLHDALEQLRQQHFDVVLADLSLGDARGLDAVDRVQGAAPEAALIVLSGADEELAVASMGAGAQDFLQKDRYRTEDLLRAIRYSSARKRAHKRLADLAHTDALAGLANRARFHEAVHVAQRRARRERGASFSLLFLDLDEFKQINDRFGHEGGDRLLEQVGARLQGCVRESDVVARLGGDEFAVLLDGLGRGPELEEAAVRLLDAMGEPFTACGEARRVGVSLGAASYPADGVSLEELLRAADLAMYAAKRSGGNRLSFFSEEPN